jgi:chaperonin GroES
MAKKDNTIKAKPLGDRILVKATLNEEQTKGGIIIPSSISSDALRGEVVSVGNGLYTQAGVKIPMAVEVGDTVLYDKHSAVEIRLGDETYLLLRESDLLVVLR